MEQVGALATAKVHGPSHSDKGFQMSDIQTLEGEILGAVSAAPDEAALEAVRVAALGKKGSISELLKTLGAMTPDERKINGPLFNGLRDKVAEAIAARKAALGDAALNARLGNENRRHPAAARPSRRARSIPSPRCSTRSRRSSPISASPSPKARTSNSTTTISPS